MPISCYTRCIYERRYCARQLSYRITSLYLSTSYSGITNMSLYMSYVYVRIQCDSSSLFHAHTTYYDEGPTRARAVIISLCIDYAYVRIQCDSSSLFHAHTTYAYERPPRARAVIIYTSFTCTHSQCSI